MSSPMTNEDLVHKCREFIVADPASDALDMNIKNALVTANREICLLGGYQPLAWLRQSYDELFTHAYAAISAVTQANPGVITAESEDANISSDHGFVSDDILLIAGINGMTRLNNRFYTGTRASATTLTLKQLDNQNAINTTATTDPEVYQEYDGGGYIYHAGLKLAASTIEPQSAEQDRASYRWKIKRIWNVMIDGHPCYPISEEEAKSDLRWNSPGGRPTRWRYWRRIRTDMSSYDHYLMLHPIPSNMHNIAINIEKDYPDLSQWTGPVYPPHPPEIHDFIWHRALANMATNAERQRRESTGGEQGRLMGQIEVLYAKVWYEKRATDDILIKTISKQMLGEQTSSRGLSA